MRHEGLYLSDIVEAADHIAEFLAGGRFSGVVVDQPGRHPRHEVSAIEELSRAGYFAATFLGQKMKLRILCEKLLIISQRFFGIPPFRFYALLNGIKKILSQTSPGPPEKSLPSLQLELLLGWDAPIF